MKFLVFTILLLAICPITFSYEGSSFHEVWAQIKSDEYRELPENNISLVSLYGFLESKIKLAAKRTLNDRSDILPYFRKLAHPNGVCLAGEWEITEENSYSGHFKKGVKSLFIARASTAMTQTKRGHYRGFGMAGKLFPTLDKDEVVKTGNFFVVDDLGGTKALHYTDVEMTNSPETSPTIAAISHLLYALKVAFTFGKADENPNVRQLYEVSELGENNHTEVITPKWIKIVAQVDHKANESDFRDELSIENYNGLLRFNIFVSSTDTDKNELKKWQRIGQINFTESVSSSSCDHRLHFHHPKWK